MTFAAVGKQPDAGRVVSEPELPTVARRVVVCCKNEESQARASPQTGPGRQVCKNSCQQELATIRRMENSSSHRLARASENLTLQSPHLELRREENNVACIR